MLAPNKIIGADISEGMMDVGRKKVADLGLSSTILLNNRIVWISYEENSFDAITAAFGVRNFENIEKGISPTEFFVPEVMLWYWLSTPAHFPMKQLLQNLLKHSYSIYRSFSFKEKTAYHYLPASIKSFLR